MPKQSIYEYLRKRAIERYKDWRERIAVAAAVDAKEVEKLLDAADENVTRALIDLMRRGGTAKLVSTTMYKAIQTLFRTALQEKRHYGLSGPTGIGKTYSITQLKDELEEEMEDEVPRTPRVGYLYVSEFGNRKTTIMSDVAEAFRFPTTEGGLGGRRQYKQLVNYFAEREGYLLVVDEAQRLDYGAIEALRCLMDQTQLSFLFLGSNEFETKFRKKRLDGEMYGQFIRRVEWSTPIRHATATDVKLYLDAYGIESTKREASLIAQRIAGWGDLSTLYNALNILGRTGSRDEMSWRGIGAGRVLESVEVVIGLQKVNSAHIEEAA